jgi:hypothetical protein
MSQQIEQRRIWGISAGLLVVFGLIFLAWALWGIHRHPGEAWFYGALGAVNLAAALWAVLEWRRGVRSAPYHHDRRPSDGP